MQLHSLVPMGDTTGQCKYLDFDTPFERIRASFSSERLTGLEYAKDGRKKTYGEINTRNMETWRFNDTYVLKGLHGRVDELTKRIT